MDFEIVQSSTKAKPINKHRSSYNPSPTIMTQTGFNFKQSNQSAIAASGRNAIKTPNGVLKSRTGSQ